MFVWIIFGILFLIGMLKSLKRALSKELPDEPSVEQRLALLEAKSAPYAVRARLVKCQGAIALRKHIYREAEFKRAFYIDGEVGIKREGPNLVINLVFESRTDALVFETVLTEVCTSWSIEPSRKLVKVKKFSGKVMEDEDGDPLRVYVDDYTEAATDSPDGTHAVTTTVASNFSESGVMVKYQSIQRIDLISGGEAEKCHIVPKCELETPAEKSDPNNMFAMCPTYHKLYDGRLNLVPKMRISVMEKEVTQSVPVGRVGVSLLVEFTEDWVGQTYGVFLKPGSERVTWREWRTWVFVENREVFENNIRMKYDITTKRWENEL